MKKNKIVLASAVLVTMLIFASWGYFYATAQTPNRLAVIEDEEGNQIAVEPLNNEVWNKLIEIFHNNETMWIGGDVEVFLTIQPDEYYRWGFRFKPETITVAEVTAEGLQSTIESISKNLDYWLDVGQAYVLAKVIDYFNGEIQISAQLNSNIITKGDNLIISTKVTDDFGNSLEEVTVTATIGDLEILYILSDHKNGHYQTTINTSVLNQGTYEISITAQKEGYKPNQTSLTLTVTQNNQGNLLGGIEGTITDQNCNPLAEMRVGIISGTTGFPEIAITTNEAGYYQIGSVPSGTFEVAVHNGQGEQIGLGTINVKKGEVSTLNFVIQSTHIQKTEFTAVVNEMRNVEVLVYIDLSNGLNKCEAKQIATKTFIEVLGDTVMYRLETITFNDTQLNAHYTWGINENDMGHTFNITADLTTLQITVTHCR